jgi:serine/threonine protein kinase
VLPLCHPPTYPFLLADLHLPLLWLAMLLLLLQEYMEGGTVHQLIIKDMMANGRRRMYTVRDALDMCLQMAEGLNYLHTAKPMVITLIWKEHIIHPWPDHC